MAFKMQGWSSAPYRKNKTPYRDHGPQHGSSADKYSTEDPNLPSGVNEIKAGDLDFYNQDENLGQGYSQDRDRYSRNTQAAEYYDRYVDKSIMSGDLGIPGAETRLDIGSVDGSGDFVRRYKMPKASEKMRHKSLGKTRWGTHQPTMLEWGSTNPVYFDEQGQLVSRDYSDGQWDGDPSNVGTLPGDFTSSQLRRIGAYKDERGNFLGSPRKHSFRNVFGREKVKGKLRSDIHAINQEGVGWRGTEPIESYVEGRNISKTVQRDPDSLQMRKIKTKEKGKGSDSYYETKHKSGLFGIRTDKIYRDGNLFYDRSIHGDRPKRPKNKNQNNVQPKKEIDGIKVDMPEIKLTPKAQQKRDRKHIFSQMFKRKNKKNKNK